MYRLWIGPRFIVIARAYLLLIRAAMSFVIATLIFVFFLAIPWQVLLIGIGAALAISLTVICKLMIWSEKVSDDQR